MENFRSSEIKVGSDEFLDIHAPEIKALKNRIGGNICDVLRYQLENQIDTSYITDLILALEKIENFQSIPSTWDQGLATHKKPKAFKHGKLKEYELWHAHFPLHGTRDFVASNILKLLPKEIQKSKPKKEHGVREAFDLMINDLISRTCGLSGQPKDHLTSHWLIFKRHRDKNYYLMACDHIQAGDNGDWLAEKVKNITQSEFPDLFA